VVSNLCICLVNVDLCGHQLVHLIGRQRDLCGQQLEYLLGRQRGLVRRASTCGFAWT
jgi:hypothetical protein